MRGATAHHVLFDECVLALRGTSVVEHPPDAQQTYVLLPFHLTETWVLSTCVIHATRDVPLIEEYHSFIARVDDLQPCCPGPIHRVGIALSAILSFVTERPCFSPGDDYLCSLATHTDAQLLGLALQNPIPIAGPGAIVPWLPDDRLAHHRDCTSRLIDHLLGLKMKQYRVAMQTIRLVHLSILNKRRDFGLAYTLLVAAIESAAQAAIGRDAVEGKFEHSAHAQWETRANADADFKALFDAYRELRGKDKYLNEQYLTFIERFAPASSWEEFTREPHQDWADALRQHSEAAASTLRQHMRRPPEYLPTDLPEDELRQILSNSYKHRSGFVHTGKQPPHREPIAHSRYFQEQLHFDDSKRTLSTTLLPNYELLLAIARHGITNWIASQGAKG